MTAGMTSKGYSRSPSSRGRQGCTGQQTNFEYAFLGRFGVSPKAYLHRLRLNGVRKALRNADPTATSVTALAIGWGFWHMGQFAKDYKQLFAELPLETLKKRHARL